MRFAVFLCLFAATPATAQLRPVPVPPANEREALDGVEVILLNEGISTSTVDAPRTLEVTAADGTRLVLERVPGPAPVVAPGAFAKARYVPVSRIAPYSPPPGTPVAVVPRWPRESGGDGEENRVLTSAGTKTGFFSRFTPHEPTYGAFGLNDAGGKLQLSFAFRPFDGAGALDHLRFAYSQTMFWNLAQASGPFSDTVYSPEVFVEVPIADDLAAAVGYRHDSNGEGPTTSIDVNRVYARVTRTFDLGGDWRFELTPQAWFFVGKQGAAPDLATYWGYTGLTATVIDDNGAKISLTGRGNFDSGKGSAELFVSHPLEPLGGDLGLYLFGQVFRGYGERLNTYNQSDTHARLGIALTR